MIDQSLRGKIKGAPSTWHAWEFTVRALSSRPRATLDDETERLLLDRCTCFDALHIAAGAYRPDERSDFSRGALWGFRQASLRRVEALTAGLAMARPQSGKGHRLLYAQRAIGSGNNDRYAVNDEEVARRLIGLKAGEHTGAHGGGVVPPPLLSARAVVIERLPLAEQMSLLSGVTLLIAAHGQALAWMPFMPWRQRAVGVIELLPRHRADGYHELAAALGIRYLRHHVRLVDPADPGVAALGCGSSRTATPARLTGRRGIHCGNLPQLVEVRDLLEDVRFMLTSLR